MSRDVPLVTGEYYHVFNRGVDKRSIVDDTEDVYRFFDSVKEFNYEKPIGSLYEQSFRKDTSHSDESQLVIFLCYCLLPNHFHFLVKQNIDGGISEFMKRFSGGYTKYFNNKYKRSGALFQGTFKSVHVESNEQLLYTSAYVNVNDQGHQLGRLTSKLVQSSFSSYISQEKGLIQCDTSIILEQFKNTGDYETYVLDALEIIKSNKSDRKLLEFE